MKAHEIESASLSPTHGDEWQSLLIAQSRWLREIAYQLACFNGILSSDVRLDIHIHNHGGDEQPSDLRQFAKEIIKAMKEMTDDAKQAILEALTALGQEIIDAAATTAKTETDQIVTAIAKLMSQNGPITRDDVGGVLEMIKGVAPKVKEGVAASIDAISKNAGADEKTGDGGAGTGTGDGGPTA